MERRNRPQLVTTLHTRANWPEKMARSQGYGTSGQTILLPLLTNLLLATVARWGNDGFWPT
jgi:hypothetical protein